MNFPNLLCIKQKQQSYFLYKVAVAPEGGGGGEFGKLFQKQNNYYKSGGIFKPGLKFPKNQFKMRTCSIFLGFIDSSQKISHKPQYYLICDSVQHIGVARGGTQGTSPPPPEIEKMLQKTGVISEGSIFSNNFSKNHLKFNYSIESLSKIFSKFPNNLCFSSKRAKN